MPIDPTTLHGRAFRDLTLAEREAIPEGAELRHPTGNFAPFRLTPMWVSESGTVYDKAGMRLADPLGYVVHIPDAQPPPDCPPPDPRVYAIGRFVVVTSLAGAEAIPAERFSQVAVRHGAVHIWTDGKSDLHGILPDGVDLDTLLHAIAKAEGR